MCVWLMKVTNDNICYEKILMWWCELLNILRKISIKLFKDALSNMISFFLFQSNGSPKAQMAMLYKIIAPRLEFKVLPRGKNSRAHTEWKCKMFFNVYLTTNTPVTIDVCLWRICFFTVSKGMKWNHSHFYFSSAFLLSFLCASSVPSLFHCLSLNIYLLFSPYRPFVLCDVGFYSFLLTRVAIYLL